jgi:hypothetical protein
MPDALEVAAAQDRQFQQTGRLVGPLHGVVMAIKDQYDTFDLRTTSGADAQYANDRPPDDATFVKRLREAGAIVLAKANMAEYATDGGRSSFGGTFCNPYDTERAPGMSSTGSGTDRVRDGAGTRLVGTDSRPTSGWRRFRRPSVRRSRAVPDRVRVRRGDQTPHTAGRLRRARRGTVKSRTWDPALAGLRLVMLPSVVRPKHALSAHPSTG